MQRGSGYVRILYDKGRTVGYAKRDFSSHLTSASKTRPMNTALADFLQFCDVIVFSIHKTACLESLIVCKLITCLFLREIALLMCEVWCYRICTPFRIVLRLPEYHRLV